MKRIFTMKVLLLVMVLGMGGKSRGQASLSTINVSYNQNFDGLTTANFNLTDNTSITGVYAFRQTGNAVPNVFTADNGGSNTGRFNNYGTTAATDRAIGSASSGTPGTLNYGVRLVNNTGVPITSLDITYTGEQWRNGGNASSQPLTCAYRQAPTVTDLSTGTYTAIGALTFNTPTNSATMAALDGNATANRITLTTTLVVSIPVGEEIMLRWSDINDAGNDHGVAVDDLIVTPHTSGTPNFSFGGGSLTPFSTTINVPSAQQSYTISGTNLTPNQTNGISVTAPADFEVSLTSNTFTGTNGNTVTLSSNGTGNIVGEPVSVYVRYSPAVSGTSSGNIAHLGAGVSPAQTVAVSGVSTAYFYSKASGDLTDPATFNSAADGSGTDAGNFISNNQTFEIRNRSTATITSNWVVSGTSSKIIVGSGVNFTIPAANTVTGTVDVQNTGKLTLQNTTLPTLGSLAGGSTVEYAQSGATTITNTTTGAVTYANLILSGSGTKTFDHAVTTVTGNLVYDGATNGPLTVEAAGTSAFTTINLGGDLTYLGSVTNPTDVDAYTLITTSTGTQTITGNGNTARFFKLTCNSSGNNVILSTSGGSTNLLLANASNSGGLQLNTGTNLSLNGNTATWLAGGGGLISGAGTITGSATSSLVINRALAGAFGPINFASGSRSLGNLTINHSGTTPTVTLGTALDIYGTLTITAGQAVLGANNLTLKSTATGTARFAATAVTTPISYNAAGRVIVERYINNVGRKWRLLSTMATVSTQNIFDSWQEGGNAVNNLGTWITAPGGVNGFDGSSNTSSILKHDQVTPAWVALTATNTGTINDDPGYMLFVRGDRNDQPGNGTNAPTVLRTTGQLRVGAQAAVTVSSTGSGYTLVGNPFASSIDFESIYTTTNLDQQFYVWDATLAGNYGVGGYRLVERNSGVYQQTPVVLGGGATPDANSRYIHSGQAFFLKATGADASVVFDENAKVAQVSVVNPFVNPKADQQLLANLLVAGAGNNALLADGIRVRFNDAYHTSTADDIIKMGNFEENLSAYRDGKKLIVEKRPMIVAKDTIFLRMSNTGMKDYRFQIATTDFIQAGVAAYLEDTYKGSKTLLDLNGTVNNVDFNITSDAGSANPDRFRIVFENKMLQPQTSTVVKAAQQGAAIAIDWKASNQYNMKQYEVEKSTDGINYTKVNTRAAIGINGSNADYSWLDVSPAVGDNYYRIRSIVIGGDVKISQPVVVTIAKGNRAITVYPNPVVDRTISLKFTDMEKGIYQLRLVNANGQVVLTKTINHNRGSAIQTLVLGNRIAKGNYLLEILKPDNTKTNEAILIAK